MAPPLRQSTLDFSNRIPARSDKDGDSYRVSKRPLRAKTASKATKAIGDALDRVETDVLLAIKPLHLGNIVSGAKNHEYRKYRLRDGVVRLWLYETRDGGEGRASIT